MHRNKPLIPHPIPPSDLTTLSHTPWCIAILSNPSIYIPIPTPSRIPKGPSLEDTIIAETLSTSTTIKIWQTFYYLPDPNPLPSRNILTRQNVPDREQILAILSLGEGLNGHPRILHGGAIALILDEVLGRLAHYYCEEELEGMRFGGGLYTAYLNTTFKKPITTPCVVLCRAWIMEEGGKEGKGVERRGIGGEGKGKRKKFRVEGVMEDGVGGIFARGEALMVLVENERAHKL